MRCRPAEVIVVDGNSTDRTLEIARRFRVRIISDHERGLAFARMAGARQSAHELVAFVDADIVVPEGGLQALVEELNGSGLEALQAGILSRSMGGYWAGAQAFHQAQGRSRHWFGLSATVFRREVYLAHEAAEEFRSGEDVELRWRLKQAGVRFEVSTKVRFLHRFPPGFGFALGQWIADGEGLARMIRQEPARAVWLAALPFVSAVRGSLLALTKLRPELLFYFLCYGLFNYLAMGRLLVFGPPGRSNEEPRELHGNGDINKQRKRIHGRAEQRPACNGGVDPETAEDDGQAGAETGAGQHGDGHRRGDHGGKLQAFPPHQQQRERRRSGEKG